MFVSCARCKVISWLYLQLHSPIPASPGATPELEQDPRLGIPPVSWGDEHGDAPGQWGLTGTLGRPGDSDQ